MPTGTGALPRLPSFDGQALTQLLLTDVIAQPGRALWVAGIALAALIIAIVWEEESIGPSDVQRTPEEQLL